MADVITRLKVESNEYDNKLKRASQSLLSMQEAARRTGATMAVAEKEEVKFAQSLGNMQTVARNAKGKLGEMTNALTEMSIVYKRMTDEEKKGEFGRALNASIQQLTQRCKEAKSELADVTKSLGGAGGGFSGVLQEVGGRLGANSDLMGMLTTGTIAYTAAIGAAAAGAAAAAKAFYEYNTELAQQNQIVEVTTGLIGENADAMRDQMRAVSKVYGVDFRESINAANTLMTQFGISGDEATKLIRKGMQGMIQGDGPKLLQMIQQYAPAYRDAGIEASQLVAIINNTEGGIFTDQNMAAITMGIKNIRMMKDTTKEAMQSIGIDADTMARKLNDGTMSVFDALKQVSDKIDEVGPGSQAAGEIMNDIFGKQGVAAGTNLGKAIAELNLNLEETSRQTGGVGDKLAELTEKTAIFEREMNKAFGVKNFEEFKIAIESDVIDALNGVLITFNNVKDAIKSTGVNFSTAISGMVTMLETLNPKLKILHDIASYFHDIGEEAKYAGDQIANIPDIPTAKDGTPLQGPAGLLAAANSGKTVKPQRTEVKHNPTTYTPTTTKTTSTTTTAKPDIYAEDSIRAQQKLVEELRDKWNRASAELRDGYKKQLDAAEAKLQEMQGKTQKVEVKPVKLIRTEDLGPIQQLQDHIKLVENSMKAATSIDDWKAMNEELLTAKDRLADFNSIQNLIATAMQNGIDTADFNADGLWKKILSGENIPDETWQSLVDEINAKLAELELQPIKLNITTGNVEKANKEAKEMSKSWSNATSMMRSASQALNSFQNPAAKVAGMIAETVAALAAAYAQNLAQDKTTKGNIWAFIAAAAAATVSMGVTIAEVKKNAKMANGGFTTAANGVITGSHFSGDVQPLMVNAGEAVINQADQAALFRALKDGNLGGGSSIQSVGVRGTDLLLCLNNELRSQGKPTL